MEAAESTTSAPGAPRRRLGWPLVVLVAAVVALVVLVAVAVLAPPGSREDAREPSPTTSATSVPTPLGEAIPSLDPSGLGAIAVDGPDVVAAEGDRFVRVDGESGERRWTGAPCRGARLASPVSARAGHVLVVRCEESIAALSLETGEVAWQRALPSEPTMVRVGGGRVVISLGEVVEVVDLADGALAFRWEGPTDASEDMLVAADGATVYVGEDDRLLAFEPDGTIRWVSDGFVSTVWSDGEVLLARYIDTFRVLDVDDGGEIDSFVVDRAMAESSMIVGMHEGHAVAALADEASTVFGIDIGAGTSTWSKANGTAFLGLDGDAVAVRGYAGGCAVLDLRTGEVRVRCRPGAWSLAVHGGRFAIVEGAGVMIGEVPPG